MVTHAGRGDTPAEEKSYVVARDARVVIEGKDAKLADVNPNENGPPAALKLSLDQKTVNSIIIGSPDRAGADTAGYPGRHWRAGLRTLLGEGGGCSF